MDDKWEMFKNYMHNELGVTKEDIREWITEAAKEQAKHIIDETFDKNDIDHYINNTIRQTATDRYFNKTMFNEEVTKRIAKSLVENFRVELK